MSIDGWFSVQIFLPGHEIWVGYAGPFATEAEALERLKICREGMRAASWRVTYSEVVL